MACPSASEVSNTTFINACFVANSGPNNTPVQAALQTCYGSSNVFTVEDGCYTYCNITTPVDEMFWTFCLGDDLEPQIYGSLDANCYSSLDDTEDPSEITASGRIPTTWSIPDETLTVTETSSGSADATITLDPADFAGVTASASSTTVNGPFTTNASSTTGPFTSIIFGFLINVNGSLITATSSSITSSLKSESSTFNATLTPPLKPTTASSSPSPTTSHSKAALGISFPNFGLALLFGLLFFQVLA